MLRLVKLPMTLLVAEILYVDEHFTESLHALSHPFDHPRSPSSSDTCPHTHATLPPPPHPHASLTPTASRHPHRSEKAEERNNPSSLVDARFRDIIVFRGDPYHVAKGGGTAAFPLASARRPIVIGLRPEWFEFETTAFPGSPTSLVKSELRRIARRFICTPAALGRVMLDSLSHILARY